MCLIAFALNAHPDSPLLIAANRDEHLDRPTQPLHAWRLPGGTPVVAGRDRHAGGTWLGATPNGRMAMLTNVREWPVAGTDPGLSRGELVTRWLDGDEDWSAFVAHTQGARYNGFNLVLGDLRQGRWAWLSNRGGAQPGELVARALEPGIYGLSNAALDSPWPKTLHLKTAMAQAVDERGQARPWRDTLLRSLLDETKAPAHALPQTGAPRVWEHALSSAFVDYAERRYGTRCSTLVNLSPRGLELEEWTHQRPEPLVPATGRQRWPLTSSHYRRMLISM